MKESIDVVPAPRRFDSTAIRTIPVKLSWLLLCVGAWAATLASASAANLIAPGQAIIGVAAAPGSSSSAIASAGTVAGANNYPGAESPNQAIDGSTTTKYLNFAETNAGFIITIPGGSTYVNGFQFSTANDAPERDPFTVVLEGTTAPDPTTAAGGATWTQIYAGPSGLAADPGRTNAGGIVNFANSAGFNTYRMLVTEVRNSSANSLQFSEIQFFGTTSPDTNGPLVVNRTPAPGTVGSLSNITVNFNESVSGVDATDLLINGAPAASVVGNSAAYTFHFAQPPLGPVQIAFAVDHGIQDFANPPNEFDETSTNAGWQYTLADLTAPTIVARSPLPATTVAQLNAIQVNFSEAVTNVSAGDLLINGVPATNLLAISPSIYTWEFSQPATGEVTIAFAPAHGITDLAAAPNAFAGASWTNVLNPNFQYTAFVITEFLASNGGDSPNPLRDEDGDTSDWIEIYNPDTTVGNIGGFYITDAANSLTKWRFPAGATVPARGYLVIFASGKNRTNVTGRLHTNFQLNNNGEYLGLINPETNVVSEYFPLYPEQSTDISYGRDRNTPTIVGYYATPTPGAHNVTSGLGFGPGVKFSRSSSSFVGSFQLALSVDDAGSQIRYTIVNTAQDVTTATNIPTTASTLYTGPITVTNTMQVRARAFPTNTSIFPGAPRTESYVQLSTSVTNFSSPLPIIVIHTLSSTAFSGGYPAFDNSIIVQAFDNDNTNGVAQLTDTPQVTKRAGINLRGSSTQGYPKSSYAVEFWDEFNMDEEAELLGLPKESDWVLYAPNRFDQVRIHNPFYHAIGNMLGRYSSRTRFVEVFVRNGSGPINANLAGTGNAMGDYWGIYVLEEKVKRDGNRVDIHELKPEQTNAPAITGGYLLKVDRQDGNERSINAGGQSMVYQDPDGLEMVTAARAPQAAYLASYLNLFNATLQGANLTNGTGTNHYSFYFDVDAGIDHNILGTITLNADAMRLSGYMYKPRGGKLTYGPIWDVDRGLGTGTTADNDWRAYNPRGWTATNPLGIGGTDFGTDFFNANNVYANVWYARLFNDPDFWQKWIDRWQELRATIWTSNALFAVVDSMGAELMPAEPRDRARWGGLGNSDMNPRNGTITSPNGDYSHTFPGTYQGELDFQKKWIGDRLRFIDTNFLARPTFNVAPGMVANGTVLTITDVSGKAGTKIYYTLDGTDPRASQNRTNASAIEYTGPITISNNVRVVARAINPNHRNLTGSQAPAGVNHLNPPISSSWSGAAASTFFTAVPPLIVTELLFNPTPPTGTDTNDADNFEYIELRNIGSNTLNLAGFRFTNGINFTFAANSGATIVAPGGYIVVAKNTNSFVSRYGAVANLAGGYEGNLDNGGERVTLVGAALEPVLDFTYSDEWFDLADGSGFSLVVLDDTSPSNLSTNTSWRVSSQDGGSPGAANPAPVVVSGTIVINEVLSHTDPPTLDTIELLNVGSNAVDISGWWLTDDFGTPKKFQIPNGTVLAPGAFITFDEAQFNAGGAGFALGSDGDEVYVFSGANGFITGYYQGTDFGASQNGRTFGRYTNSQGTVHFVAQATNTLGTNNSLPLVGPIVISEVMYHPPEISSFGTLVDNEFDEYIELRNISATNVPLYHSEFPVNTWRLSGGVEFYFPTNVVIPPGGSVLVVGFNPAVGEAAFRAEFGVPAEVPIFGPIDGKLDNSADRVRLGRPDAPNGRDVPYIAVDQIDYTDLTPWPAMADGLGASLHRIVLPAYGNDPTNWFAARATPGTGIEGGALATITQQPMNLTIIEGNTTNLSVAVTSPTPVRYQWYHNTNVIPGATDATLVLTEILAAQSGLYSVGVFNGGGGVFSTSAVVTVRPLPVISQQPSSQNVLSGTNVTIAVVATGTGTLRYQWQFGGVSISGATNASYSFNNANLDAHHGNFRVLITDDVGTQVSSNAFIYVLVRPGFLVNPLPVTVLAGGSARFTAIATGAPPIGYRWLRQGTPVATNDTGVLILTNVLVGGNIRVLATNLASGASGVNMVPAGGVTLTVLPDADRDGISDLWETNFFGSANTTNNVNNALEDPDGDKMINRDEYVAGTNPTNGLSYLRVDLIGFTPQNEAVLQFDAVSNRTYTLDFRNTLDSGTWTNLFEVPSATNNRTVRLTNLITSPMRLYRVTIPGIE